MTQPIQIHACGERPVRARRPAPRFDPDSPQFSTSSSRKGRKPGPKKKSKRTNISSDLRRRMSESANSRSHHRGQYHTSGNAIEKDNIYCHVDKVIKDGKVIQTRESRYFTYGYGFGLKPLTRSEYMSRKNLIESRRSTENSFVYKLDLRSARSRHQEEIPTDDATVVSLESKTTTTDWNMTTEPKSTTSSSSEVDSEIAAWSSLQTHEHYDDNQEEINIPSLVYEEFNSTYHFDDDITVSLGRETTMSHKLKMADPKNNMVTPSAEIESEIAAWSSFHTKERYDDGRDENHNIPSLVYEEFNSSYNDEYDLFDNHISNMKRMDGLDSTLQHHR